MIRYRSVSRVACVAFAVCVGAVCAVAASAQAADFYKGKTINLVVGSEAGGGYDTYSRFFARTWPKFIPGQPNIVVQNMPGAGSLKSTNYLYNVAAKDGTVVAGVQQGILFEPLFKSMGSGNEAKFDALKLGWLGAITHETSVMVAWHATPFKSMADLRKSEVLVGSAGATTNYAVYARLMNATMGTKLKIVEGYNGTSGITHAMEQGEIQALTGWDYSSLSSTKADWLKNKDVLVLVQFGAHKIAPFPDVPLARDETSTAVNRQVLDLITLRQEIGRPYLAPPGLPKDRLKILQTSFQTMLKDPGFLKEAERANIVIDPSTPEECQAVVKDGYAASPDIVAKARAILVGETAGKKS
jgi:tripartite-type tricarboxylate transporter receptor subunit TctC